MSKNRDTSEGQEVLQTIGSFPFTMQITHNGETTEFPAHQTLDMRYEFSQAIPSNAEWVVLQAEVSR